MSVTHLVCNSDGPGGVLVCYEGFIEYRNPATGMVLNINIPERQVREYPSCNNVVISILMIARAHRNHAILLLFFFLIGVAYSCNKLANLIACREWVAFPPTSMPLLSQQSQLLRPKLCFSS
jgi:hypothetical protein